MQNINDNMDSFTSQFAVSNQNDLMDNISVKGVSCGCLPTQNIGSEFWI